MASPLVDLVLLVPPGLSCLPEAPFSRGLCGSQTRRGLVVAATQRFYEPSTGFIYVPSKKLTLGTEDTPTLEGYVVSPPDDEICSLENAIGCTYVQFKILPTLLRPSKQAPEFDRFADLLGRRRPSSLSERRELFEASLRR